MTDTKQPPSVFETIEDTRNHWQFEIFNDHVSKRVLFRLNLGCGPSVLLSHKAVLYLSDILNHVEGSMRR